MVAAQLADGLPALSSSGALVVEPEPTVAEPSASDALVADGSTTTAPAVVELPALSFADDEHELKMLHAQLSDALQMTEYLIESLPPPSPTAP